MKATTLVMACMAIMTATTLVSVATAQTCPPCVQGGLCVGPKKCVPGVTSLYAEIKNAKEGWDHGSVKCGVKLFFDIPLPCGPNYTGSDPTCGIL